MGEGGRRRGGDREEELGADSSHPLPPECVFVCVHVHFLHNRGNIDILMPGDFARCFELFCVSVAGIRYQPGDKMVQLSGKERKIRFKTGGEQMCVILFWREATCNPLLPKPSSSPPPPPPASSDRESRAPPPGGASSVLSDATRSESLIYAPTHRRVMLHRRTRWITGSDTASSVPPGGAFDEQPRKTMPRPTLDHRL